MAWNKCDRCDGTEYTEVNPFVEVCQQRPSDHSEMCCVLAGHMLCMGTTDISKLPDIGRSGGTATPEQWETWIESPEAAKMGFCFKT